MGSKNKTANLNLNLWEGTDKPQRTDFIYDNEIVDEVLGEHIEDAGIHLSNSDRALLETPTAYLTYVGDGKESRDVQLPISCKSVFVYRLNKSPVETDENGKLNINFAYSVFNCSSSPAIVFDSGSKITVGSYENSRGEKTNLNSYNATYLLLCIR